MKLNQFLTEVFSTKSPRHILRSLVGIFESQEIEDKEMLRQLFLVVESVFHLQYGKVLVAQASLEDLARMVEAGWPYFTPFMEDVTMCINRTSCKGLQGIIESLGEHGKTHLTWIFSRFISEGSAPPSHPPCCGRGSTPSFRLHPGL